MPKLAGLTKLLEDKKKKQKKGQKIDYDKDKMAKFRDAFSGIKKNG
jgi:hypothetical protein